jgi:chromate reductase
VFSGKPGAIVSVTPYGLGAFGANHHLRQSLVYVNVLTMAQPEAYVSQAGDLVDADNHITKEATKMFLVSFLNAYTAWIEKTADK